MMYTWMNLHELQDGHYKYMKTYTYTDISGSSKLDDRSLQCGEHGGSGKQMLTYSPNWHGYNQPFLQLPYPPCKKEMNDGCG